MQQRTHKISLAEPDRVELLPNFTMDLISRIELRGPVSGELMLERKGGRWIIPSSYGHLAKSDKVDELALELEALSGQFRSEREDVLADYGLADTTAVSMKLISHSGEELAHLHLGSSLSRGGLFLCRAGSSKVYSSQSGLLRIFNLWGDAREPDARGFLDMTLWTWDPAQVESFTVVSADDRMVFNLTESDTLSGEASWLIDGVPANKTAVDQVLGTLKNLKGKDLLDPAVDHGFSEGNRHLEISLIEGEAYTLLFGQGDGEDGDVPFKLKDGAAIYALYSSYPDRIFKARAEFTH
jgi:hypothetical protein